MRRLRPTLAREAEVWAAERLLVGVDEVGRGPLAGPVVAAAVVFPPHVTRLNGLRDSKVLTPRQREKLAGRIRRRALALAVGAASCREIDRLNIRVASAVAMRRAVLRVLRRLRHAGPQVPLPDPAGRCQVLIDGLPLPELGLPHEALVDGDALCDSIAAAAVIAKTVRDGLMTRLAARYPGYGWETNMGYATADHCAALGERGPTRHHRLSFEPLSQLRLPL